jgi:hypothetical protein
VSNERERVREILRRATTQFERNGLSRGAIRQCEREFPALFVLEGLHVLIEADDSAGYRFLAVLLVNSPSVFQELTERWQFTKEEAVKVARGLQRVDQNFDTRLAALLPDRHYSIRQFALEGERVERALEILDDISPGRRIVSIMHHLTDHKDPKISSKAALLIGKRLQSFAWARRVIAESTDPRLRANAIETMWGVNTPEAVELFRGCLADWDNRVVGNAIIGLHRAGHSETKQLVAGIAANSNPKLRMTAAWAMGQIRDAALASVLNPLAKDGNAEVRRSALRSLRQLQIEEQKIKEAHHKETTFEPIESPLEMKPPPLPPGPIGPQRQFWG